MPIPAVAAAVAAPFINLGGKLIDGIVGLFSEGMEDPDKKAELALKASELKHSLAITQMEALSKLSELEVEDAKSARALAAKEAETLPQTLESITKLPTPIQLLAVPVVLLRVAARPLAFWGLLFYYVYARFVEGVALNAYDYGLLGMAFAFYYGGRSWEKRSGIAGKV